MKLKFKNLIAFTLSEMMIVLLIVSVISAATIPTITQKKQKPYDVSENNSNSSINWRNDNFSGIFSAFSLKDKEHSVVVGKNTKNDTTRQTIYGSVTPALMLAKSTDSQTRTSDRGQIMLYDNENFVGSFGFDRYSNTYMGYGSANDRVMAYNNASVSIGYYANGGQSSNNSAIDGTVAIGHYAMYRSLGGASNVAIGPYAGYYATNSAKSINVGYCAGSSICEDLNSYSYEKRHYPSISDPYDYGNIAIGASSGHLIYSILNNTKKNSSNNISIGYFSNRQGFEYTANSINSIKQNKISIGSYAGMNSAYADTISIGYKAGFDKYDSVKYSNIAIGYYSGNINGYYKEVQKRIDIGSYANNNAYPGANTISIGPYTSTGRDSRNHSQEIAIGYYAWASKESISIGAYAYYGGATWSNKAIAIGRYTANGQETNSIRDFNNIYIGKYAGYLASSSFYQRIFIGNEAGASSDKVKSSGITSPSGGQVGTGILIGYGTFAYNSTEMLEMLPYASRTIVNDTGEKFNLKSYNGGMMAIGPGYGYPGGPSFNNTILVLYAANIYARSTTFSPFTSDRRSKENIEKAKYGIEQFRHINTYTYNFKFDKDKKPRVGLIAQEVQKYIPEAIVKSADGTLTIDFDWILYSLANAIKDVDNTLTQMKNDLIVQAKDLTQLEKRIFKLENKTTKILEKQEKMQIKLNKTKDIVNNMETK